MSYLLCPLQSVRFSIMDVPMVNLLAMRKGQGSTFSQKRGGKFVFLGRFISITSRKIVFVGVKLVDLLRVT